VTLSAQDRIDITDLINLHGHFTDAGELDRYEELLTPDVVYDVTDVGLGALHGPAAVREAGLALGAANPVGHHITNIVITALDDRSARVRSKAIGIRTDGSSASGIYEDVVTRGPDGWKISYRKVIAGRAPLGGRDASPRDVLRRWRQAVVDQSVDDLRDLYCADAVHTFPFTRPGLPSRLEGRDEIMDWVAEGWRTGPLKYERYLTIAIHDTADPDTIVVEQDVAGVSATTGEFTLPNIFVLTVRDGRIAELRDYVNVLAAAAAIGRDL
jgi:ketosteroid isomerase-like protein